MERNERVSEKKTDITANEYQKAAERTISQPTAAAKEAHALHGMVSEIGELHSIYQKAFQGHDFDEIHAMKEVGDLLWFVAEYCTAMCWNLSDVMEMNIEKLKKRYPEGFEEERSLHREEGDV